MTAAHLLFGKFDALAGLCLVDSCLLSRGVTMGRRELVGDIVQIADDRNSPFVHALEEGHVSHPVTPEFRPEALQRRSLTTSVSRVLRRAGFVMSSRDRERIGAFIRDWSTLPPSHFPAEWSTDRLSVWATLGMPERSVQADVPLLSNDCAAPAWLQGQSADVSVQILRVVWDEV